ncbi:MAG: hypothetical protein WCG83_02875 [Candidatus Peregrinibacteria bacterium]
MQHRPLIEQAQQHLLSIGDRVPGDQKAIVGKLDSQLMEIGENADRGMYGTEEELKLRLKSVHDEAEALLNK